MSRCKIVEWEQGLHVCLLGFYIWKGFFFLSGRWWFFSPLEISNNRSESRSLLSPHRRLSSKSLKETPVVGTLTHTLDLTTRCNKHLGKSPVQGIISWDVQWFLHCECFRTRFCLVEGENKRTKRKLKIKTLPPPPPATTTISTFQSCKVHLHGHRCGSGGLLLLPLISSPVCFVFLF